ncbi:MAG: transcriptional regulator, partial [Clostridia bacterium]|nr:transcriptional regulator [Clostridia bacterium]
NELLSGERLDDKQYHKNAEENIMDLLKEKAESKKKIIMSVIICCMTLLAAVTLVVVAGLLNMDIWLRVVLTSIAFIIIVAGISLACVLDRDAGAYECPACGEKFVPSMKSYVFSAHTLTKRKLKCPHCGKKSYCKKRLSK